ncbi:TIGR00341 family protein [Bergeyella zoohelcum]|uniref:TIGR00341 family protein n=1 Tax=Bergeyella zoohelcum TaxID=1015 RepID=UPI002A9150DE|nr:TIGR00341 family protein [Bergeyella zoohelcum]MDY6025299.1 TIGR00341 family protein [Bergeyella zoohelcum]
MLDFRNILNLKEGEQERKIVLEDVYNNISFRGANLWILACAILIASIGLNVNSTAVIIGAMLISPLMGPIVGAGFSLAIYDFSLFKKSGKNLLIATIVSLLVSFIYFFISPFKDAQSEILARTTPTIYDVMIAFFGGVVGAISITRKEKGNPIPGVAIATALMPPLCTAGYGLATANFSFFAGAMYLYTINCVFIAISTFIIAKLLKYTPHNLKDKKTDDKVKYIIFTITLLMIIPSSYLAYSLFNEKKFQNTAENFINKKFVDEGYALIYKKLNYQQSPKTIELAFLHKKFDSLEIKRLNKDLEDFGLSNTHLIIKQGGSDLKAEILSQINNNNNSISEKDITISKLRTELKKYTMNEDNLHQEIKVLYPEIKEIYFGRLNDATSKDSIKTVPVVIYTAESQVNEENITNWLKVKLDEPNVKVMGTIEN